MDNSNSFIREISSQYGVNSNSTLHKYLVRKTQAANRGSKARRSLGNLYALYVLCEDFLGDNYKGSSFTDLMKRMKSLPFGAKLQNHPLDNRLNDEMRRQYNLPRELLPVQPADLGNGKKARKISVELLSEGGIDPKITAEFVVSSIDKYISTIEENQTAYLTEIENAESSEDIIKIVRSSLEYNSDARLFEVVSFALLHIHYKQTSMTCFVDGMEKTSPLYLYKTGRTNANDGGIDFVLKPIGKFFQVTETLDFKKYFLDFDKTNRFSMSFVVKTEYNSDEVRNIIKSNALDNMPQHIVERYMSLFDDIITNNDLNHIINWISTSQELTSELKDIIVDSFKLEYGLLD